MSQYVFDNHDFSNFPKPETKEILKIMASILFFIATSN